MSGDRPLTDRTAAGALLCYLLSDYACIEANTTILSSLRPGDMFQVEYMMILEAAQKLYGKNEPITLAAIEAELAPEDPARFATIVLHSLHENRHKNTLEICDVEELVSFLVSFRDKQ